MCLQSTTLKKYAEYKPHKYSSIKTTTATKTAKLSQKMSTMIHLTQHLIVVSLIPKNRGFFICLHLFFYTFLPSKNKLMIEKTTPKIKGTGKYATICGCGMVDDGTVFE